MSSDTLLDTFEGYRKVSAKRSKPKARKLAIKITSSVSSSEKPSEIIPSLPESKPLVFQSSLEDEDNLMPVLEDDPFDFYSETHEEQAPEYKIFKERLRKEQIQQAIVKLSEEDKAGLQEIDTLIKSMLLKRKEETDKNLDEYEAKSKLSEEKDQKKWYEMYQQRMKENRLRIHNGIRNLQQQFRQELENAMAQHRQQCQQRGISDQQATQEWASTSQQITSKQQRQLQEFHDKGEELNKKTNMEFKQQEEKLRNAYAQKREQTKASRETIYQKLVMHYNQTKQRYIKRHIQRIAKKRLELINELEGKEMEESNQLTAKDLARTAVEDQEALRQPSPIKSIEEWALNIAHDAAGASTRHKHRKGVMSNSDRQLSIEIHNEGLWIGQVKKISTNDASVSTGAVENEVVTDNDFVPWGVRAHRILQSIMCGEIPRAFERYTMEDLVAEQGGQIRCHVLDLRTSEETAALQRAKAFSEQEKDAILELEKKFQDLSKMVADASGSVSRLEADEKEKSSGVLMAAKEVEAAKRVLVEFRNKAKNYLGPDDTIISTTLDPKMRDNLIQLLTRYKDNVQKTAEKESHARQLLNQSRARLEKIQSVGKLAKKNLDLTAATLQRRKAIMENRAQSSTQDPDVDRSSFRIKEMIASLQKVAKMRRAELNNKKSGSVSSAWVQKIPGLPAPLRKSIWSKMHRRKLQIVLRPTQCSIVNGLREKMLTSFASMESKMSSADASNALLSAEQKLLVALHPLGDSDTPSVPSSKGTSDGWAEPGWPLRLDVPETSLGEGSILPRTPYFPLLESNLSEILSAPGNQAASLQRPSHFRSLAKPLSSLGTISSLSEESVYATSQSDHIDDFLHVGEDDMKKGYEFRIKTAVVKPPVRSRASDVSERSRQTSSSIPRTPSSEMKKRRNSKGANEGSSSKRQKQDTSQQQIEQLRRMQQQSLANQGKQQQQPNQSSVSQPTQGDQNQHQRQSPTHPSQQNQNQQRPNQSMSNPQTQPMGQPPQFNPQAMQQMPPFYNPMSQPGSGPFQNQFQPNMNMMRNFQGRGPFPPMQFQNQPMGMNPPPMQPTQMGTSPGPNAPQMPPGPNSMQGVQAMNQSQRAQTLGPGNQGMNQPQMGQSMPMGQNMMNNSQRGQPAVQQMGAQQQISAPGVPPAMNQTQQSHSQPQRGIQGPNFGQMNQQPQYGQNTIGMGQMPQQRSNPMVAGQGQGQPPPPMNRPMQQQQQPQQQQAPPPPFNQSFAAQQLQFQNQMMQMTPQQRSQFQAMVQNQQGRNLQPQFQQQSGSPPPPMQPTQRPGIPQQQQQQSNQGMAPNTSTPQSMQQNASTGSNQSASSSSQQRPSYPQGPNQGEGQSSSNQPQHSSSSSNPNNK